MPVGCNRVLEEVERLLGSLRGVRAVAALDAGSRSLVLDAEQSYERHALVPVLNLGVRQALERESTIALLKDGGFRPPPIATIYLVEEEGSPPADGEALRVGGRIYRLIGEELLPGVGPPSPGAVRISDTFVMYPDRRRDPTRPSWFLLPPVPFPELEPARCGLRLGSVVSSSASSPADALVRRLCGFPADPALATLLIGFDTEVNERERQAGTLDGENGMEYKE